MPENLGSGVSYVYEADGYAYDTVVINKGKPVMDSELNYMQQLQHVIDRRQLSFLPSGWMAFEPVYTSTSLENSFYTQNPTGAIPEFALVNGMVIHVTNTQTSDDNANLVELGDPPGTGNEVNGIFLEVWRALIDPDSSDNKPDPTTAIDALLGLYVNDANHAWAVGENGLIIGTTNAGQTWNVQLIDTKRQLNGIFFISTTIGWVVGDNGVIARTSSGGQAWSLLSYLNALTNLYLMGGTLLERRHIDTGV